MSTSAPISSAGGFHSFAGRASQLVGSKWAFTSAVLLIALWAITGPIFHYSDTWQLVINTATTVITFLIVFLIQNTQNRDARAIHLKLDEIIHALGRARNDMIQIENLSDQDLQDLAERFSKIRLDYVEHAAHKAAKIHEALSETAATAPLTSPNSTPAKSKN
ncbi:MAG TPA: low affinity iron permease family protein [Candidatus Acidoferrum sp.]|jgi:low affinity Fe/Cu permease